MILWEKGKGEELIVSRATIVKLSNQTKGPYMNHADDKDFFDLLAYTITFQFPFFLWKENKMRNYDRLSKYTQAPFDFKREGKREGIRGQHSHHSQVIQTNLVKVYQP